MQDKKFKIVTLGCKVNQYESAYLEGKFAEAGWQRVSKDDGADVTVINTCIVTRTASHQSRQAIRKAIRESPSGIIAAIGCYAQVLPDDLLQIEGLDIIAGNTEKARLPDIIPPKKSDSCRSCVVSKGFTNETPFEFLPVQKFSDRTRAFLKIQDGCDSFCSYCVVPFARGPIRSLAPSRVIDALKSLHDNDYKEVVLTGVHLGKYGCDLDNGIRLKGILYEIGKKGFPMRVRLSSIEPNEIDCDLIEMVASEEWLCRHFHVPLQSGDDRILKKMRRHYTSKEFGNLVERIHSKIPLAAIGVDIMTGFPGEDEQAYHNTFYLIKGLPVSYTHVFPFSPRKGTAAAEFHDQVDREVIKERARELRDLGKRKREAFYRSCLGQEFSVLTEGWISGGEKRIKGLSDNYLPVFFPSSNLIKNSLLRVRIDEIKENGIICSPVSTNF